eukprot:3578129-Amphidinium_carterae.1
MEDVRVVLASLAYLVRLQFVEVSGCGLIGDLPNTAGGLNLKSSNVTHFELLLKTTCCWKKNKRKTMLFPVKEAVRKMSKPTYGVWARFKRLGRRGPSYPRVWIELKFKLRA